MRNREIAVDLIGKLPENPSTHVDRRGFSWAAALITNAESVMWTVTSNFTNRNPQFASSSQRNFNLSTDSPVWALGFQPIPTNRFGPAPTPPRSLSTLSP